MAISEFYVFCEYVLNYQCGWLDLWISNQHWNDGYELKFLVNRPKIFLCRLKVKDVIITSGNIELPDHWAPMSGTSVFELVTLAHNHQEHLDVSSEFKKTCPNSQIVKVCNSSIICFEKTEWWLWNFISICSKIF